MKTEKRIRRAAKLLGDLARKCSREGDEEDYEVASTLASAMRWCLGERSELTRAVDGLIRQAESELTDTARN